MEYREQKEDMHIYVIDPVRFMAVKIVRERLDAILEELEQQRSHIKFDMDKCSAYIVAEFDDMELFNEKKFKPIIDHSHWHAIHEEGNGNGWVRFGFEEVLTKA